MWKLPCYVLGSLAIVAAAILVGLYLFVYFPVPAEKYYVATIEYNRCYSSEAEGDRSIVVEASNIKYIMPKAIWTKYGRDEEAILESLCRSTKGTIWLSSKDGTDIKGISTPTFSIDPAVGAAHDKSEGEALLWVSLLFFALGAGLVIATWLAKPYVHKQSSLDEVLPYVVRAPLWLKLLQLPIPIILWAFFWPAPEPYIVRVFREGNYILFFMMLFTLVIICSGLLQIFVQKTVFHRHGIEHRSAMGMASFRQYADIDFLHFKATSLTVVFSDAYKITIFKGVANLTLIAQIIDRLAPKPIDHVLE